MGKPSIAGSIARAVIHSSAAGLSARTSMTSNKPIVKALSALNTGLQINMAIDAGSDLSKAIDRKREEKQQVSSSSGLFAAASESQTPSSARRFIEVVEGGKPGERWKVELYDRYGDNVDAISKARKFVFTGIDREYSPVMASEMIKKHLGIDLECRKDFKLYMRKDDSLVFVCKYY